MKDENRENVKQGNDQTIPPNVFFFKIYFSKMTHFLKRKQNFKLA
jgi:hypothetical protein